MKEQGKNVRFYVRIPLNIVAGKQGISDGFTACGKILGVEFLLEGARLPSRAVSS
jgi:hypothetical protein